jgi:hypothetical protein
VATVVLWKKVVHFLESCVHHCLEVDSGLFIRFFRALPRHTT